MKQEPTESAAGAGRNLRPSDRGGRQQVTGTTGIVFLYGIAVGVVGMFGLSLLLTGASRVPREHTESRSWRHPFGHGSVSAAHR